MSTPLPTPPPSQPLRVAVLASGRGSNLQALIDAQRAGLPIEIALVAGDKPQAQALRRAEAAGIATLGLDPRAYADRPAFDGDLLARVAAHAPDLVVLAGYMRILAPQALAPWAGRMINIHPSLLPAHRGLRTHERAIAAGDGEHGATVHYVTAELDGGPRIAQARLAVLPGDTPDRLAARLLPHEHRLLQACVEAIARGRVRLDGSVVLHDGLPLAEPLRLHADGTLARAG